MCGTCGCGEHHHHDHLHDHEYWHGQNITTVITVKGK